MNQEDSQEIGSVTEMTKTDTGSMNLWNPDRSGFPPASLPRVRLALVPKNKKGEH